MRTRRRQRGPYTVRLSEHISLAPYARTTTWQGALWDTRAGCLVGGTGACRSLEEAWAQCLAWIAEQDHAAWSRAAD